MLERSCRNFEACKCFVRKLWRSFSAAGGSGTYRTPAPAEDRRVRPAHYWNSCCSRCLHSFYSGAATHKHGHLIDSPGKMIIQINNETGAYFSACNGELFLALLALSGLIILQPGVALMGSMSTQVQAYSVFFSPSLKFYSINCTSTTFLTFYLQSFVDLLEVLHF